MPCVPVDWPPGRPVDHWLSTMSWFVIGSIDPDKISIKISLPESPLYLGGMGNPFRISFLPCSSACTHITQPSPSPQKGNLLDQKMCPGLKRAKCVLKDVKNYLTPKV